MLITRLLAVVLLTGSPALARTPTDPFPTPIPTTEGVIKVRFAEFASLPDVDGAAARMMLLVDEPGTRRLFVSDMRGLLYSVSYNGQTVTPFLDLRDPRWARRGHQYLGTALDRVHAPVEVFRVCRAS